MNSDNFGYNLLRDIVLPDILEADNSEILYWSGKKLYHHFEQDVNSDESLVEFFAKAQFGELNVKKSSKSQYEFILTGDNVEQRLSNKDAEFSLETGFLCEYVQTMTNSYCQSFSTNKSKNVHIVIDIDHKSNVN